MPINLDNLIKPIVNIRTIKQLSQEDCAHMLGITIQDYINFEQGEGFLSLPELELLSKYLGISLQNLLSEERLSNESQINMLQDSLRPHYKALRDKMIGAKMAQESSIKDITLDELQQATKIPLEKLTAYQQALAPIPINHLIEMANALSLPLESLINLKNTTQSINDNEKKQQNGHPESHQADLEEDRDQAYQILFDAIKKMPITKQAEIAKFVLNTLKDQ